MSLKSLKRRILLWDVEPNNLWYMNIRKVGEEPKLAVELRYCTKIVKSGK